MATTTTVSSQYNGSLAGKVFIEAFKAADSINQNAMALAPNIIGVANLPKLSYSNGGFQAYACGWDPVGTIAYVDKQVTVKKFKIDNELCKDDFHSSFQAQQQGLFAADNEIPADMESALLLGLVNSMGETLETQIWQGDGTTHSVAGLLAQFSADSDVVDVSATASITSSNVVGEIASVYTAIPEEIYNASDLVIAVSPDISRAYKQALANQGSIGNLNAEQELSYLGTPIISLNGLGSKKMVAYRRSNIILCTGLEADYNEVRIIDSDANNGDGLLKLKMVFGCGVSYHFGNEIVYYA